MGRLDLSINMQALVLTREMMNKKEELGLEIHVSEGGTTIIDCGINVSGGYEAGRKFAEVCMGGLGRIQMSAFSLGDEMLPAVNVAVDHPLIGCIASQYAGWAIDREDYFAMGSGPARALARIEDLFAKIEYEDDSKAAVLTLESGEIPPEETLEYIAGKVGVSPEDLYILIAPTNTIVGSVQISSRIVETGLHKMMELGFDLSSVKQGWGLCPVATVAGDSLSAIGRTNDAVLYGGTAYYNVEADDGKIEELVEQLPSSSSPDYGQKFKDLYQRYGNFYEIDAMLFSPARVIINNLKSGRVFRAGRLNIDILFDSLLGTQDK